MPPARSRKPPRFAWAPSLGSRETATSYLSRLAFMNGRTFAELHKEVGIEPFPIECGREDAIRKMASFCGQGHGGLCRWTPRQLQGREWTLHGHRMPAGSLDRTKVRVCPACILEDVAAGGITGAYQRAEWLVTPARSCRRHRTLLYAKPAEKAPFMPHDFTRFVETSMEDIERAADVAAARTNDDFGTFVQRRFDGFPTGHAWLDDMPLHAAANLCEIVGGVALFGRSVRRTKLTVEQAGDAASAGFEICRGGPTGLVRLLQQLHDGRGGKGVWGARASIGDIYPALERVHADADYAAPVAVVRRFLLDNVPLEAHDVLFGALVGHRRVHTLRTAVRESGTHSRTIRKIMTRKSLVSQEDLATRRDHHVTISAAEVDEMLSALKDSLSTPQITRLHRIPRLHLREFVRSGVIKSATMSVGIPWAKHRFAKAEIERLMDLLFEGAVEVEQAAAPFCTLKEARAHLNCNLVELLGLLVGGKATRKARLRSRRDYEALLLDHTELRPFVRLGSVVGEGMTTADAQKLLRVRQQAVPLLMEAGLLDTFVAPHPVSRCPMTFISPSSAMAFRDAYVSLFELAETCGRHHLAIKEDLASAGLSPAFDANLYRTTLFSREQSYQILSTSNRA